MNIVEFIIQLKDGASHPLGKISKNALGSKFALDDLTKANEKLKGVTDKTGNSIGSVREKIQKLKEMKELLPVTAVTQIQQVNGEIDKLEKGLDKIEGKKMENSGGLKNLFKGLAVPAVALGGSIVASINEGMKQSRSKLDFDLLFGQQEGQLLYNSFDKMKGILGEGIFDLGKDLSESMNVGQIINTVTRLGDVSMGNQAKLSGLATAFGQINKDGKLTEATLTALEQNGFKPLVAISETTGESLSKVRSRFAAGKISALEMDKVLKSVTDQGGRYFGIMSEIAADPSQMWKDLVTEVSGLAAWIGGKLIPVAQEFMGFLKTGFSQVKTPLSQFISWLGNMYAWLKRNKDLIIPLVGVIGTFITTIYAVIKAKAAWVAITTGLSASITAMSATIMSIPVFGWILAAIAGVIAAIVYLRSNFEGFGEFFNNLWLNAKSGFSIFISYLKQGFNWWINQHELLALKTKSFAQFIGGLFGNIGKAIKLALDFDFAGAKEALSAKITTSAELEIGELKRKHDTETRSYEAERKALLEDMARHPLSGIIKKKLAEDGLDASEKATGGRRDLKSGVAQPTQTDLKNNGLKDTVNAISGGGVKNITVTVGTMFQNIEFHIQNGTKQIAYELERIAEEAVTRAIASASAK